MSYSDKYTVKLNRHLSVLSVLLLMSVTAAGAQNNGASRQRELMFSLAESLMKEGKDERAYILFRDAAELYPGTPTRRRSLEYMAEINSSRQRFNRALHIYLRLYEENSFSRTGFNYLLNAALLYEKTGRPKQGRELYRRIIRLSPDSSAAKEAETRLNLGNLFNSHTE